MKNLRLLLLIVALGLIVGLAVLQRKDKGSEKSLLVFGAGVKEVKISSDFGVTTSYGNPLIFGGVHSPDPSHLTVWDELQSSGITSLRSDIYLEFCAPRGISLNDYKENKNNVQDTKNWTTACLANLDKTYSMAKDRGMKVVAIVAYTPPWLTKGNTTREMPIDWDVYNDLVGKTYRLNRHNIDYLEVWNEPDHPTFFKSSGGNKKPEDAYVELYENVSKTVRAIDEEIGDGKRAMIGGPSISKPQSLTFVQKLLESQKGKDTVDFVSVHLYEGGDEFIPQIKKLMTNEGYGEIPIYISEWNYGSTAKIGREFNQTYAGVPYSAERLINFFNNDVDMASYFSLRENIPNHDLPERQSYGFYQKVNNRFEPFPQINVWKLMSHEMKLGLGESRIVSNSSSENMPILSFVNTDSESGSIIVNQFSRRVANYSAKNIGNQRLPLDLQLSKITPDGLEVAYCNERVYPEENGLNFKFELPANSVVAVKLVPYQVSLRSIVKILATSTEANCILIDTNQ